MLVSVFKRNAPFIPILILLLGLLLWADGFIFYKDFAYSVSDAGPLFSFLEDFFRAHPLLDRLMAFVILLLQVFLLNGVGQANSLLGRPSWLPGFIYLLMMSSHPQMLSLHPALIANLFLIIALARTFKAYSDGQQMTEVFNVASLVALAGLFYYPALVFFFWLVLALGIYFLLNLRGISAALIGFFSPFFFLFTYFFLTDQLESRFFEMTTSFKPFLIFEHTFSLYPSLLGISLGLISLVSFMKVILSYANDKPIRIRKRFRVLFYFFLVCLATFLLVTSNYLLNLSLLMIPLSIVFSIFLLEFRKKRIAELILFLFILLVITGKILYWI